jgi:hypothetical protein
MQLVLQRQPSANGCTIGRLTIDGQPECWTLEDVVRPPGAPKVYGQTAIPAGTYRVTVSMSPRFKTRLPLLLAVPGFEGIRIHPGNTEDDTEGCILVGQDKGKNAILRSRAAFEKLLPKLEAALARGEPITIEIRAAEVQPAVVTPNHIAEPGKMVAQRSAPAPARVAAIVEDPGGQGQG